MRPWLTLVNFINWFPHGYQISNPHFLFLSTGFEAARHFLQSKQIPDSWKMDLSEILESSSSDEENEADEGDGKESEEELKEPQQEEVRL